MAPAGPGWVAAALSFLLLGPAAASAQNFVCDGAAPVLEQGDGQPAWGWTEERRVWCCEQQGVACHACDTQCESGGFTATCRERIGWAKHKKIGDVQETCQEAFESVTSVCSACGKCTVTEACGASTTPASTSTATTTAAPTTTTAATTTVAAPGPRLRASAASLAAEHDCWSNYSHWRSWSQSRRTYCCQTHSRACQVEDLPAVEAQGGPFDCVAGFSEWRTSWNFYKKRYCCEHQQLGCPASPAGSEPPGYVVAALKRFQTDDAGGYERASGGDSAVGYGRYAALLLAGSTALLALGVAGVAVFTLRRRRQPQRAGGLLQPGGERASRLASLADGLATCSFKAVAHGQRELNIWEEVHVEG